jgi:hypothetical protein
VEQLHINLLAVTIRYQLPLTTFRALADWLECYSYEFPRDRRLLFRPAVTITNSSDLFKQWLLADIVSCHYGFATQLKFAYKFPELCMPL